MRSLFLCHLSYQAPLTQVDAVLPQHKAWLQTMYEQGNFLISGRYEPRTGGMIIALTSSRQETEELLKTDPFVHANLVKYEVTEWMPSLWKKGLESFIDS